MAVICGLYCIVADSGSSLPSFERKAHPSSVPSPPIGLKADNIKATSMTISWQPPHDVEDIIRGYQVSYTPHGESEYLHDIAGNTTSTELTGLRPHTEYTIRVRAKTVDYGEYSIPSIASTLEEGELIIIGCFQEAMRNDLCTIIMMLVAYASQ